MKIILFIILYFFSNSINAQYFKISPNGYVLGENNQGVILEFPNRSKTNIYNALLGFINERLTETEQIISPHKNKNFLKFTTIDNNILNTKSIFGTNSNIYGFTTYEIEIDHEKIKLVNIIPDLYKYDNKNPLSIKAKYSASYYNMNGEPRELTVKYNIIGNVEKYYNNFIDSIITHINNSVRTDLPTIIIK